MWRSWLRHSLHAGRMRVRLLMAPLKNFIDMSLKPHYGPGVDSASNKMCTRSISREVKATFRPSRSECLEICIFLVCFVVILSVFVLSYVYLLYYVCIAVLTLDAGLLARSQYPGGPATGHLDTGFSWFPCVYKRMLRWFPSFQVATTCFSCNPSDLNFLVTFFPIFVYM